jgi:hypothetical protein
MSYVILFISSAVFYFFGYKQWQKNLKDLKKVNAEEPKAWKRALNGPYHMIWPAYLFVFATGLIVNNLIFR